MKQYVYLIFLIIFSAGCTQHTVQHVGSVPEAKESPETSQQRDLGTGDSGGGNGVDGKALEIYRMSIKEVQAYQNIIKPHIVRLKKEIPKFGSQLENIFVGRIWYFVPETLSTIDSENIGVAFATEQLALQNTYEVWIDKNKFDKMTAEEQATLLLHEALMGMKINLDQDYKNRLLGKGSEENNIDFFRDSEKVIEISKLDYSQIRAMTSLIADSSYITDLESFIVQLRQMKFGSFISGAKLGEIRSIFDRKFSVAEVLNFLNAENYSNNLPASCKFEFIIDSNSIRVRSYVGEKLLQIEPKEVHPTISIDGIVNILFYTKSEETVNSQRTKVQVTLVGEKVGSIKFVEEIYTYNLRDLKTSWRTKGGERSEVVCFSNIINKD